MRLDRIRLLSFHPPVGGLWTSVPFQASERESRPDESGILRLQPGAASPPLVGAARPLRYDPVEAQRAGLGQNDRARRCRREGYGRGFGISVSYDVARTAAERGGEPEWRKTGCGRRSATARAATTEIANRLDDGGDDRLMIGALADRLLLRSVDDDAALEQRRWHRSAGQNDEIVEPIDA